jgi:hypothetical protein
VEPFVKKLRRILRQEFPKPDKLRLRDEDGVIGHVISSRFKAMDTMDRVNLIWDLLDKELTREERKKVVIMIALTPQEERMYSTRLD